MILVTCNVLLHRRHLALDINLYREKTVKFINKNYVDV